MGARAVTEEQAAREEAGHALVFAQLRIPVERVEIRAHRVRLGPGLPRVTWVGSCRLREGPDWSDRLRVIDYATGWAAGLASEMVQGRPPNIHATEPEGDRAKLWRIAERLEVPDPAAFVAGAMARAISILQVAAEAWDRLTAALLERGTLEEAELQEIVYESGPATS